MIRFLFTTVFLTTFWTTTCSQKYLTTFYDSNWLLTTKPFANYIRKGVIDTITYKYYGEVKDFYLDGKLQMKGRFEANIKVDTFYFYYPSGKLQTKGVYENNLRYGFWTNYYENGRIKDKLGFIGDFICALEYYDEYGTPKLINGTGEWETEYYNDLTNETIYVKGSYIDTLRQGVWSYTRKSLDLNNNIKSNVAKLQCTEEYDHGKFISGKYYWGGGAIENISRPVMNIFPETKKFENLDKWNATKYASVEAYPHIKFLPKVDSTVLPVDKVAEFPGGLDSLRKVFAQSMKLSEKYISSQKSRSCAFTIVIDVNGKPKIFNDPNGAALKSFPDNQIFYYQTLKIIKKLPKWKPAMRGNKVVINYFMLAVSMDNGEISVQLINSN